MKTWEIKLLAGNNGIVQMNVQAHVWRTESTSGGAYGLAFTKYEENGDEEDVAFFPLDKLVSVKDVTP